MASRRRSRFTDAAIDEYAAEHSSGPDEVQQRLQSVTAERTGGASMMQIGDDQAVLMETLVRAMGAKRAVEVGTFTGYSALAVARGLGPGGHLLCCDVSEEWTAIAREAWEEAGVADRIELKIAPAAETLRALPEGEQFDFAFIDADKTGYPTYFEEILPRLRTGGLVLIDNVLQNGRVIDRSADDESVVVIRQLNDAIVKDDRVRVVLLPIGDGVSVVQKL
ncbi:MAG TPA: class I SAM-dependent methyltransferase [Acidimicrobiia bacterium]|jgi:caffeoyl-CoA O-methyltransferase